MAGRKTGSYQPTEREPYMNTRQLHYFAEKLTRWRQDIYEQVTLSMYRIKEFDDTVYESVERSAREFDQELEILRQHRYWRLLREIDSALGRIKEGTYGYCEETEEPIGLKRLEVSPIAKYCLFVQENYEKQLDPSPRAIQFF